MLLLRLLMSFVIVPTVAAMPTVSKKMHEEATEEEHKREVWREVLTMVDDEIDTDDNQKPYEHPVNSFIIHVFFT